MENGKIRKKDSARLVWDSKPRRAANPKDIEFQTAEVVIPNPVHRGQLPLSFGDGLLGEAEIDKQKMNRLIWGDNLLAMQALLAQGYEGKINLIYIDPPFDSKADYSHKMTISLNPSSAGEGKGEGLEFTKEPSVIERLAYKDTWAGGTDSYLDMLYPRLQLMKRLLAEDGSIYVHCDWHANSYLRIMMDEVFGKDNFLNEIIWCYKERELSKRKFNPKHDTIFFYCKNSNADYPFNYDLIREEYSEVTKEKFKYSDDKGKKYRLRYKDGRSDPPFESEDTYRQYFEYEGGPLPRDWFFIPFLNQASSNRTYYATEKPPKLIEKLILAASNPNHLIADFFCGSGTTLSVAEKLNRRWIGCELGKVGIQVTRARLVEQQAKPFLIENIGNYQREMIYLTGGRIYEMQQLILKLYGATPRDKMSGLGIRRAEDNIEELVYVGYPDRPVTAGKAEELAGQAVTLDGRGYKRLVILGWDYEYNYHQAIESRLKSVGAHSHAPKVEIISRDIPPDIYDYLKKAKTEEDIEALSEKIKFCERPYLKMDTPNIKKLPDSKFEIILSIKRYCLMDIPISQTSKKGQEDYDGFTFKSQWQAFRGNGKKAKTVITEAKETLEKKNGLLLFGW